MSTICATCCSRNLKLSTISLEHWNVLKQLLSSFECIKDYVYSEPLKICKECSKMLKNILLFRNKVVKSISVLEDKLINSSGLENVADCDLATDQTSEDEATDTCDGKDTDSDQENGEEKYSCNSATETELENVADCDLAIDQTTEDEATDTCDGKDTDSEQENAEEKYSCNSATENELENVTDCDLTTDQTTEDEATDTCDGKDTDSVQQNGEEKDNCNSAIKNEQGSCASELNGRLKGRRLTSIDKTIVVNLYKRLLKSPYKEKAAMKTAQIMSISKTTMYRTLKEHSGDPKSSEALPTWFLRVLSENEILKEIDKARKRPVFVRASHKCVTCVVVFKDDIELTEHNKTCHNNDYGFPCRFCSRAFASANDLRGHLSRHRDRYTCMQCLLETDSEQVVNDHQCTYDDMNDVEEKKEIVSPDMGQFFYCKTCDVHFDKERLYKQHMKTTLKHMNQDILKYPCSYCVRRFMSPCHLRRHVNSVHFQQKGYKCNQCNKLYAKKSNLNDHIALKHENKTKERKYICEVCASAFSTNGILKNHMRRHTGERPYKCKVCAATFSYSGALYTHNKLVHERVKITGTKTKKKQKK